MTGVRIRTYRHGLGDCFLLTFWEDAPALTDSKKPVHILIDCGVLVGTPNAKQEMQKVLADIRQVTEDHVHVIVATHEHWDHVSGFNQARDDFDAIKTDKIWMAWTEHPGDDQAIELRREREERKAALAKAVQLWDARVKASPLSAGADTRGKIHATKQLLEFHGEELGAAAGRRKTSDAMAYLREHKTPKRYLEPGMVLNVPGLDSVRVFVLGPPRTMKWLKKERPSKRNPETYTGGDHALTMAQSFFAAVEHRTTPPQQRDEMAYPFDEHYRQGDSDIASVSEHFRDHYVQGEEWRKIDHDWLGGTSDLALALDSDTNNTSLVLAFELGEDGEIMLFPGDAQVGNWLSWQEVEWADEPDLTADEILERTIFYKVAHHGSHNATMREQGLEKMKHPGLMAMVPVDADTATKKAWAMPFEPLWDRLNEKCRGRVLRSDKDGPDGRRLRRLSEAERAKFKAAITKSTDLFIDLEIQA